MRIAMMGAGGIGGYLGARLAEVGEDVHFIARGAHLAAIQSRGLRVLSPFGDVHLRARAVEDPGEVGPVDLVFFAVKLWDTESAARQLAPLVGPTTRIVTLQNGIDSFDLLARHLPRDRIVKGVIYVSAAISEPGVILSPGGPRGMAVDRRQGDPVLAPLGSLGKRTIGLDLELTDEIDAAIWAKFIRIAAFSAATAITRSRVGRILANPETSALLRQLVEEGAAVAAAAGHAMDEDFVSRTMALYASLAPETRASMAEDLEHGRRLEVEFISGRIHHLGLDHGVATPAHTMAYRSLLLHAGGRDAERPS